MEKQELFRKIAQELAEKGFDIAAQDDTRPWGGFFVIEEAQAPQFIQHFFPEINPAEVQGFAKLSPKILLVAPHKRLSWQYHFRRAELWRAVEGPVGVVTSPNDTEGDLQTLQPGDIIQLHQGERHRLVGLDRWGVIAEIWQHTEPGNPSDENDIVRLQDDFGR